MKTGKIRYIFCQSYYIFIFISNGLLTEKRNNNKKAYSGKILYVGHSDLLDNFKKTRI